MLLIILLSSFEDDIDREIALQLIWSVCRNESVSLSKLAERSQCSPATIHKFARRLGFEDYRRMKSQLVLTEKVRKDQLNHHIVLTKPNQIPERIRALSNQKFDDQELLDEVEKVNDLISKCSRVVILAAGYPQALSLHYMEDMIMMGKMIYALPVGYQMILPPLDQNTLVIVISVTGRLTDYFHSQILELQESSDHIVFLSSRECTPGNKDNAQWLRIPVTGDDEDANAVLVEILRCMKYDYYQRYGKF